MEFLLLLPTSMKTIYPKKLKKGDHIRVIAPARSLGLISEDTINAAIKRLSELGLSVSFGKHVSEKDCFLTSSIESRVSDLHDAFSDTSVDGILTVVGGYNSNQMLDYLDYELISKNPKILCGFSDITSLSNAIYQKTGLVGYSGPHFSSWWIKYDFEFSIDYFRKCCFESEPFVLEPTLRWSDDEWFIDQENRKFFQNEWHWIIQSGVAEGRLIGGHLPCLHCLQGTQYWPTFHEPTILFLEQDEEFSKELFDRQLQSLIQQANFSNVTGIVVGRFQHKTAMTRTLLEKIIWEKKELLHLPIIANVDFGHTMPFITFPIGGTVKMRAEVDWKSEICIVEH